jgi:hypothetical protein
MTPGFAEPLYILPFDHHMTSPVAKAVVVQFGKRLFSGHRCRDAAKGSNSERLSPLGLAYGGTAAEA